MSHPLLSVCLITYNHVNYIRQAIDGVLAQKVNFSWELIIADDFSTDGTREIVLEYKNKYSDFIKLILQKKNVGPAQNWMDLITRPQSKYVAYFEGDDYWTDPHKLQKQVDFLEKNPDFAICFHNMQIIYDDEPHLNCTSNINQREITTIEDLAWGNYIYTASCIFRKYFNELPPWHSDCPVGDYPLHLLNAQYGKIKFINEVMGVYRIHAGGIWENKSFIYRIEKWVEMLEIISDKFSSNVNKILNKSLCNTSYDLVAHYLKNSDDEKSRYYLMKFKKYNRQWFLNIKIRLLFLKYFMKHVMTLR
jgi:glycosyltransferase involved in cell wall biosynthesis